MLGGPKKTPAEWTAYLASETRPVTLWEYIAACLSRLLGAQIAATEAAEGAEGVVRRLDVFAATMAERAQLPYPRGVRGMRELDAARDADRQILLGREP